MSLRPQRPLRSLPLQSARTASAFSERFLATLDLRERLLSKADRERLEQQVIDLLERIQRRAARGLD